MRILFTTLPSNNLGWLTRSQSVAQELPSWGHAIAFTSSVRRSGERGALV
jgi:hypothetical protein